MLPDPELRVALMGYGHAGAVFHGPLQALRRGEELLRLGGRKIGQQAQVHLRHQQRVAPEERPVIQESQQVLGFRDGRRDGLSPDDRAERAFRLGGTAVRGGRHAPQSMTARLARTDDI